jgi:hypothetical protein
VLAAGPDAFNTRTGTGPAAWFAGACPSSPKFQNFGLADR